MSETDLVFSKINIVKNCLTSIEKAKAQEKDPDFQLAIFELNLQRAIQACIDMANILISQEGLGLPSNYRQAFEILAKNNIIDEHQLKTMRAMVGFRNISVHDYEQVKPEIVKSIVENHLKDFENFYTIIYNRVSHKNQ